jgi:predicted O-methyltransferase YrrM
MDFTQDLTKNLINSLKVIYPQQPLEKLVIVEIGSFEGRGSIVLHDYLCQHKESQLYCIDPFDNEYVKGNEKMAFWDSACNGQLERFRKNTSGYSKIIEWKGTSDDKIPFLENNSVDFVYIDGDHSPEQVYLDAVNMFPKMKKNGIILFDDYQWVKNGIVTAQGIDKFLNEFKVSLLFKNWQLAVKVS